MSSQLVTFGCRLNTYESEVMRGHADAAGLKDAIIINTCAVTSEAERQARQSIRRLRKENPDAKLIVTGCAAQIRPQDFAGMPEVDIVLGNDEKMKAEEWGSLASQLNHSTLAGESNRSSDSVGGNPSQQLTTNDQQLSSPPTDSLRSPTPPQGGSERNAPEKLRVNDIMEVREVAGHMVNAFTENTRAFIQVQNGCDHRCTFCIIPFGRGPSRSVPMGEIITQVRHLVEQGVKEVVLTGVDISDYGKELPGTPTLGNLVRRILKHIPELPRLRISSIDAAEVDDEFWRALAEEDRLMPHMHLSLQAGDDMVLKRMKRRHLRDDILRFVEKSRNLRPDIVFGADIIAGFPTETEEMFQNTLNLVEEANLTWLHIFPYSARTGTPAANMPQVKKDIRKERAQRLRDAGERQVERFMASRVGTSAEVLVEKNGIGHTEHFAPVRLSHPIPGEMRRVKLTGTQGGMLVA